MIGWSCRRTFWLMWLSLASASTAIATEQVIVNGNDFDYDASSLRRNLFMSMGISNWTVPAANRVSIIPDAGTVRGLRIHLDIPPGAGSSVTFTIQRNQVATSLTCTVSGTATNCTDTTNSFTVSPGDQLHIEASPTNTPAVGNVHFSVKYESDTLNHTVLMGRGTSPNTFEPLHGDRFTDITEMSSETLFPTSGTIKGLHVEAAAAPGGGKSRTFTVRKNGVATSLTCTISNNATTCDDTTNTVTIAAGDSAVLEYTESGGPAATDYYHGVVFQTDVGGEFILPSSSGQSVNTAATRYYLVSTASNNATAVEGEKDQLAQAMTIKAIYAEIDVTPGAGNSYQFTLRRNGADTAVTCTISDSSTTCNASVNVSIRNDDLLSLELTPTSSPTAATDWHVSFLAGPQFGVDFSFFKTITIDQIDDAGCGTTLTNYPLFYSVTDTDLRDNVTDPEGDDIIFRGADDTTCGGAGTAPCVLDHEIEKWVGGTGELVAWVRIPSVNTAAAASDTVIQIYYGNSAVTNPTENPTGVWSNGYAGVWHLSEDPSAVAPQINGSTSNANDGTSGGTMTSSDQVAGQIGGSLDFDGSDDRIDAGSAASLDDLGPITISLWINPRSAGASGAASIVSKYFSGAGTGRWFLELDDTAPEVGAFEFTKNYDTTDLARVTSNGAVSYNTWQHIVATRDGSSTAANIHIYKNGAELTYVITQNGSVNPNSDDTHPLIIGNRRDGDRGFDGLIDEVRIANVTRSSCWIDANFDNQNNPGDIGAPGFYTVGGPITTAELYRSVGTDTGNLNTGGETVTISGTTATFTGSMPAKIGVGDVLEYQDGGSNWRVAFIVGRTSDTVYSVTDATGATPVATVGSVAVNVYRAYTSLFNWEVQDENDAIIDPLVEDFDTSTDLLAANSVMQVAAYADAVDTDANELDINGWTTGVDNYIRIYTPTSTSEVGTSQRHTGVAGTGYVKRPTVATTVNFYDIITIQVDHVRIEGLELDGSGITTGRTVRGLHVRTQAAGSDFRLSHNLIHDIRNSPADDSVARSSPGIYVGPSSGTTFRISNNIVYAIEGLSTHAGSGTFGIHLIPSGAGTTYVFNNTVYDVTNTSGGGLTRGIKLSTPAHTYELKNNYVGKTTGGGSPVDYKTEGPLIANNNVSSDDTADDFGGLNNVIDRNLYATYFVNVTAGLENLHLVADSNTLWTTYGEDLDSDPNLPITIDIDRGVRDATQPDVGADEFGVTAVELMSFTARALDGAVELAWETASELNNLGFHLYRSTTAGGIYERITATAIPGLGSSPKGANYAYLDTGLENGVTYYYKLEDIETTGKTKLHGPVAAMPVAGASSSGEDSGARADEDNASHITYGDPSANSLRVVTRGRGGVTLELLTEGFYAEPQEDGSVRLEIPSFEALAEANAPGIPVKRAWVEALAGRKVNLVSVTARGFEAFSLRPSDAELPEVEATRDGTVRAARRRSGRSVTRGARAAFQGGGLYPSEPGRIVSVGFQGEVKKALVELAPLRWDASTGQLLLARRLIVRLSFRGRELSEHSTDGVRGRRYRRRESHDERRVVARLGTTERGLHGVRYEDVFRRSGRGVRASTLRLSRQGATVPYHRYLSRKLCPGGRRTTEIVVV